MFHRIVRSTLLVLIQLYQASGFLWKPRCRYWPTCSRYAHDAISIHGAGRGLILTVRRLAHCHPWGGSGYDPVPHIRKALT